MKRLLYILLIGLLPTLYADICLAKDEAARTDLETPADTDLPKPRRNWIATKREEWRKNRLEREKNPHKGRYYRPSHPKDWCKKENEEDAAEEIKKTSDDD